MFRYLLTLFFIISSYNYSLGVPLQNDSVSNLLTALATNCGDTFLSSQIKTKSTECSVSNEPLEMQCMLFYDINKRLCDVPKNKLVSDDYVTFMNKTIDVENTCNQATTWKFTEVVQFPSYSQKLEKVLHTKILCLKMCATADFTSLDTNFFCKYFLWGWNKLQTSVSKAESEKKENKPNAISDQEKLPLSDSHVIDPVINESAPSVSAVATDGSARGNQTLKLEYNKSSGNGQLQVPEVHSNLTEVKELPTDKGKNEVGENNGVGKSHNDQQDDIQSASALNIFEKPQIEPLNKKVEGTLDFVPETGDSDIKSPLGDKSKADDQPLDYKDTDDANDLDSDVNGDDQLDGNFDLKPEITEAQTKTQSETKNTKPIDETLMSYVRERELYPVPDQFVESNDNFFPFFLTGIILVVLLYILYHNKSKVSKVVLGLLVEGRQPGRRRNSRGHAYKRLDTLEQAMSTNSQAPPSKIIY